MEDNDPRGYKSGAARAAKEENGIRAVAFPRYSPDLNPLDFCVWAAIEARMAQNEPRGVETVAAYKARLRRTALRLPTRIVRSAVESMPKRMKAVVQARGGNIKCD